MKNYIKSISLLNQLTLSSSEEEINRYSESDIHWATNKGKTTINREIKKGNIYQFEFGKNYIPEMSYEHRGLVIGKSGKLIFVLPIFSYNKANFGDKLPVHLIDNPNSKSNYYLLKRDEFSFLNRDSVIKLNDIRTVSPLRIKYSYPERIDPDSSTYKLIEKKTFEKYFGNIAYEYNQLKKEIDILSKELADLKEKSKTED